MSATVAVNTSPRESDLAHGNVEEMTAGWTSSKPAVFAQDEQLTPEEHDRKHHFWALLLIGAALLLFSESMVSNHELRNTNDEFRRVDAAD